MDLENQNDQFEKYYVIDTNIVLEDSTNVIKLSANNENLVIIPETVLDEIDTKKGGFDEINFQAREFARFLENAKVVKKIEIDKQKIVRVEIDDINKTTIDIISKSTYKAKSKDVAANIYNDRKILEIASFANEYYDKEIVFLTMDSMAKTRAISIDLKVDSLKGSDKSNQFNYEFEKDIEINFDQIETLHNKNIYEIDPNYNTYNFSYNIKIKDSDQVILASVDNERINVLDEEEIRNQIITPLNKEQLFFSNAILSPYYSVLIVEAKAGSGKTLLALSGAMKLIRRKEFQRVIYIRNSIESLDRGEDVGYLPGLEEKFKIYNHPLMDSLDYIVRTEYKKKKASKKGYKELEDEDAQIRVDEAIKKYSIETMWVGEMRGRTLSNAIVIIDEAQNMSNKTMQMVLSRIDSSCKVIILGSNKQIDNIYINKHTNALTTLLNSTKNKTELVNIFAIKLKKVLRGPITEWAESLFSKK